MNTPDTEPNGTLDAEGGERIAKRLARAGLCSRRDAERWIAEGRVAVNGTTLTSPACVVRPGDVVQVDNKVVPEPEPTRLWRYHKPSGLVTTARDEKGRETVFDRMPPGMPRVVSVGRLDLTTEGLLLLTNDGELARFLELPSTGWTRRYRVRVFGEVDEVRLAALADGPTIDGVKYGPVEAVLDRIQGRNAWLTVGIREGKNREIRKLMDSLGLQVNRLIRVAYGPFQLGKLGEGEVEEVPKRVVKEQVSRFFSGGAEPVPAKVAPTARPGEPEPPKRAPSRSGVGRPAVKPIDPKSGWAKAEAKTGNPKQGPKHGARKFATASAASDELAGAKPATGKPARGRSGWARPKAASVSDAAGVKQSDPNRTPDKPIGDKPAGGKPPQRKLHGKPVSGKPAGGKPTDGKPKDGRPAGGGARAERGRADRRR